MSLSVRRIALRVLLIAMLGASLVACATFQDSRRSGVSSSLVTYLYPDGEIPPAHAETQVRLALPVRVGIAFVPSTDSSGVLPEALKMQALTNVRNAFADRPYIRHIEVIPEHYLRASGKGMQSVEQIARLHGLDLIALVSYDQVSLSQSRDSSLLYWTLVGAYTIHGTHNEVNTFVDTAVIDVRSRRLLFRAPGINRAQRNSSLVNAEHTRMEESRISFTNAMSDMITHLDTELDRFRERVRTDDSIEVSGGARYGGSPAPLLLMGLGCIALHRRLTLRPA